MSHWVLSFLSSQTSEQRNRRRVGEGCCKSSKLSWWQLFHPLPGYQRNSGTGFTGFRVHQECLLFTEKTEWESQEKSIWGIFSFQGVCEAYFPANVRGISKLEWAQECTFVNTRKELLFPVWCSDFKLIIWSYSKIAQVCVSFRTFRLIAFTFKSRLSNAENRATRF